MTAALEGGEWSAARPGRTLSPGKTRYPFYRRVGGVHGEKDIHRRFSPHLHINNILVTEQYGFRKGISTEDAAFRPAASVFKYINPKKHVGEIFCDLAKAFDCVNHTTFSAKLNFYGILGLPEDLFRTYFTNRTQKGEVKSPNRAHTFFSDRGTMIKWSSSRINSSAPVVHKKHSRYRPGVVQRVPGG